MSAKVSKALSASGIVTYHSTEFAANYSASYFLENGKARGVWFGKECQALGLVVGEAVTEEHLTRLAYGQDPNTGEQLIEWRIAGDKEPAWVKDQTAWENRIRDVMETALLTGQPVFTPAEEAEPVAKSKGASVEPAAIVHTQRQTALVEMHAMARQTFIENLQSEEGKGARAYLKSRGIHSKAIQEFGLGVSDASSHQLADKLKPYGPELMRASGLFVERPDGTFYDRFRDRLMFPIENEQGETIAFGGRRAPQESQGPKYINSPETELYQKNETLYNLHRAAPKMAATNQAVAVEGYLDVVAAYQAGQHNVVAPCGTALTAGQADVLRERASTLVLNFDPDDAGKTATEKAVNTALNAGLSPRVVSGLDDDPAGYLKDHEAKEYREAVRDSSSLIEYLGERAPQKFDVSDVYGKMDAVQWMVQTLAQAPPALRSETHAALTTHLGGVPVETVKSQALEHRGGWDICFSAGKSISLTGLVGGDERVIAWHDEAVREALSYAEQAIQVKMGGMHAPKTTGKMVAAVFRHDTSRPVDGYAAPQLHSHCVVYNMSQDERGQFRALNPTEIFHLQSAMDAVYQARLAYRAVEAGYELAHSPYYAAEIKGYTPEYLEAESKRTAEIEEEKERQQQFGPEADSIVALKTRSEKLNQTPEEVRASHQAHGEQYGNQAQAVVETAKEVHNHRLSPEERALAAERAVEYARSRLSERTAVMEWHEIDRDALRVARGTFTLPDVQAAVKRAKERGQFQETHHWRDYAPMSRYTTPELQAKEHKILSVMVAGKNRAGPIAGTITKDEFREQFRNDLNDGQKHLVWNLIHSEDRIVGVQGIAGTGKTTALAVVRQFAKNYGFDVRGVAATGNAANELTNAGIPANTLAGFLLEQPHAMPQPRLFLLDEASLSDIHTMSEFLDKLRPEDRAIVIGDVKQHGSVGAGQIFKEFQDAGMETYYLRTIVRQLPDDYKAVVKQLSRGEISEALDALKQQGRIHEQPKEQDRHEELAHKFVLDPELHLAVAPDNRARVAITEEIRTRRTAAGQLGEVRYESRILEPRSELQKEDLKYALHYNPGDVLAFAKGNKTGLLRGDLASLLSIDPDKNELTVMRESDGKVMTYNPSRTGTAVSVYKPAYREFAQGDRVQFTKNLKNDGVTNRQLGTITMLTVDGFCKIALDHKKSPDVPAKEWVGSLDKMPHLDHGYCLTSFSSQGTSAHTVLVHLDTDAPHTSRMLTQQLIYVAASRGRHDVRIYTNDFEELGESLYRLEQSPTALPAKEIAQYKEMLEAAKAVKQEQTVGIGGGI